MRGMRFSSLAVLALATVAMGLWAWGCSKDGISKVVLSPHGGQTAPSGEFAVAWTNLDVSGSGRIVVPGGADVTLTPEQVKELAHSLLNVDPTGLHGYEVIPTTGADGATCLAFDPHPHGAAKLLLAYDPETGRAEGTCLPAAYPAPSGALNSVMRDFIIYTTGIPNPQDVTALKFEVAAEGYSFHWAPDGKGFGPADAAYPSLIASGLTIEGTFYSGDVQGTFSATIDRITGDARGTSVTQCPECAAGPVPGHYPVRTSP